MPSNHYFKMKFFRINIVYIHSIKSVFLINYFILDETLIKITFDFLDRKPKVYLLMIPLKIYKKLRNR